MHQAPDRRVVALIGVYDADGGLLGEARYVIGHLLGLAHCALCDITHSPVRRKPAWDRMVAGLGVPFQLRHRNEVEPDVAVALGLTGSPVVLARLDDGSVHLALGRDALALLHGSVDAFADRLRDAVALRGWALPDPARLHALGAAP